MRKLTFIISLGLAVAVVAGLDSTIAWKSKTLDLGQVVAGESASLSFEFVNQYEHPVRILEATGSCGCTEISYPKESVPAGETAKIAAKFRSTKPGVFQKNIKVQFEGIEQATYLYFKGEVLN